jgi:hypothetical protein
MIKAYDTLILPVTRAAEHLVRPPFGQSVFTVARVSTVRPRPAGRRSYTSIRYVGRMVARASVWKARLKPTTAGV